MHSLGSQPSDLPVSYKEVKSGCNVSLGQSRGRNQSVPAFGCIWGQRDSAIRRQGHNSRTLRCLLLGGRGEMTHGVESDEGPTTPAVQGTSAPSVPHSCIQSHMVAVPAHAPSSRGHHLKRHKSFTPDCLNSLPPLSTPAWDRQGGPRTLNLLVF